MINYAIIFVCYLNVIRGFKGSSILITFLDGAVRLIIPVIIIIVDFQFKEFTRRLQFLLSLSKSLVFKVIYYNFPFSFDWHLFCRRRNFIISWI